MVAGSPPTAHLFEQMTRLNLHPVHVYGMTETYGPITKCYRSDLWNQLPSAEVYKRSARQGHGHMTSREARVVKEAKVEDQVVDVQRNGLEVGEVVFVGNLCARGYYKDVEATVKLFDGGVLHSGDLAVWHPDGAIQIIDRSKDIIISGMCSRPCTLHFARRLTFHRRREHILYCSRVTHCHPPRHPRGWSCRGIRSQVGGKAEGIRHDEEYEETGVEREHPGLD